MKLWIPQESSSPTKFVFMDSQITKIYKPGTTNDVKTKLLQENIVVSIYFSFTKSEKWFLLLHRFIYVRF